MVREAAVLFSRDAVIDKPERTQLSEKEMKKVLCLRSLCLREL